MDLAEDFSPISSRGSTASTCRLKTMTTDRMAQLMKTPISFPRPGYMKWWRGASSGILRRVSPMLVTAWVLTKELKMQQKLRISRFCSIDLSMLPEMKIATKLIPEHPIHPPPHPPMMRPSTSPRVDRSPTLSFGMAR